MFFNEERNFAKPPKNKTYKLEDNRKFLSSLKKQLNQINYDLLLL